MADAPVLEPEKRNDPFDDPKENEASRKDEASLVRRDVLEIIDEDFHMAYGSS
jgi:hypothetical protein